MHKCFSGSEVYKFESTAEKPMASAIPENKENMCGKQLKPANDHIFSGSASCNIEI